MKNISFERYIKSFEAFGEYTEEYKFQLEHLLHTEERYLKNGFSVLDIGAGTGFFARDFLKTCKSNASSYTAIEPSEEHIKSLNENFNDIPVEIMVLNEIFTPKTVLEHEFDLIIMSHSLYWFLPDPEPYILNALEFLKDEGVAVMYLQTPYSASHFLNLLFNHKLPVNRVPNHRINSWTIMDILDRNHIHYEISNLPGTLNANQLFRKENKKLLDALISFFLSVESDTLDEKTFTLAEEALKKLSYKNGDETKLNLELGAITVF